MKKVSGSIAISMVVACSSAHKEMETWTRHEAQTDHGRRAREATMHTPDPCGSMEEESRSAETAKVVGFPSEWTLERQLADWLADGAGQALDGRQPAESAAT